MSKRRRDRFSEFILYICVNILMLEINFSLLEKKVFDLMGERKDYQAYYYKPNTAIKYYRLMKELKEETDARAGDDY